MDSPFSPESKNAKVDIRREYERLYELFYNKKIYFASGCYMSLHFLCDRSFLKLPIRGRCTSLDDFNETHGFYFEEYPYEINLDYLVDFCEYTYNLVFYSERYNPGLITLAVDDVIKLYIRQILSVIETIGYKGIVQGNLLKFIPKDPVVESVAEIVDSNLSYREIEYKGDIEQKRIALFLLSHKLDPKRQKLRQINHTLEDNLFYLFNKLNVRHNNIDPSGRSYIPYVANMKKEELEQWYDNIYQMCLLAFLELEHLERKNKIAQLKQNIESEKSQGLDHHA